MAKLIYPKGFKGILMHLLEFGLIVILTGIFAGFLVPMIGDYDLFGIISATTLGSAGLAGIVIMNLKSMLKI